MKLLYFSSLAIFLMAACGETGDTKSIPREKVNVLTDPSQQTIVTMDPLGNSLRVWTVTLDGNEYYTTQVYGGYTLCPKLPPKIKLE